VFGRSAEILDPEVELDASRVRLDHQGHGHPDRLGGVAFGSDDQLVGPYLALTVPASDPSRA
jgi:hypothetical protein